MLDNRQPDNEALHLTKRVDVPPLWAHVWVTALLSCSVVVAGTAMACVEPVVTGPVPINRSWEGDLARGAQAPDLEGLQTAVIRYAVQELPTRRWTASPPSTVCLTVLPLAGSPEGQPPYLRQRLYDPSHSSLMRLQVDGTRVIEGSLCESAQPHHPLTLEIGPITRWPGAREFEVVIFYARDSTWDMRKLFMVHSGTWAVVRCLNWGERINGYPSPEACETLAM
jgi:hypothetical protein